MAQSKHVAKQRDAIQIPEHCPKCDGKDIKRFGRSLRCYSCGHQWRSNAKVPELKDRIDD